MKIDNLQIKIGLVINSTNQKEIENDYKLYQKEDR